MNSLEGLLLLYGTVILINLVFNTILWLKTRQKYYQIQCWACAGLIVSMIAQSFTVESTALLKIFTCSISFIWILLFTQLLLFLLKRPLRWKLFCLIYLIGAAITLLSAEFGLDIHWAGGALLFASAFPILWEGAKVFWKHSEQDSFLLRCFTVSAMITALHLIDYAFAVDKPNLQFPGFTIALIGVFATITFSNGLILETTTSESARHRAEKEYQSRLIKSERLASVMQMAGGVAHEINNPLTAIQLYSEKLKSTIEKGELNREALLKDANMISSIVNRISRVILDLRNFSRDASEDPMQVASLTDVADIALRFCEERFHANGVKVIREEREQVMAWCRSVETAQAILNILNNAFDSFAEFAPEKWITLETRQDAQSVFLKISNNGKPIPIESSEKIFEPFFTTKPLMKGTGLGLSVALGLIRSQGGKLELDRSSANTCFVIQLKKA